MRTWYEKLTPDELWEKCVTDSVEPFLSNFREDGFEITDTKGMCRLYAQDILNDIETPYPLESINIVAGLSESKSFFIRILDDEDFQKGLDETYAGRNL